MTTHIAKICGITDMDAMEAAVVNGASFVGLVFFEKSPRNVTPNQAAELIEGLPEDVLAVGLFVNPTDGFLNDVLAHVRLDMIQLHGSESPERVDEVRNEFALPVMKAIPIETADDFKTAETYVDHADWLLFDAKAPKDADRPGGNAEAFDWTLLQDVMIPLPWMLAGGLTPDNVAEALEISGAVVADVSSGVESTPGKKDPAMIKAFLEAVKGL